MFQENLNPEIAQRNMEKGNSGPHSQVDHRDCNPMTRVNLHRAFSVVTTVTLWIQLFNAELGQTRYQEVLKEEGAENSKQRY